MNNVNVVSTPTSTFDDEKDYVFLKKLNVIYIDNDISTHKLILNKIGENINLTACDSINTAFDIIESRKYDIILCYMNANSKILKDFFKEYSQKIPIISISSSTDPKIAYMSAKMGAKDFIKKMMEI